MEPERERSTANIILIKPQAPENKVFLRKDGVAARGKECEARVLVMGGVGGLSDSNSSEIIPQSCDSEEAKNTSGFCNGCHQL